MQSKYECVRGRICPFSLGVALGVANGLFMMLFAWAGHLWHYGNALTHLMATIYFGYAPTIMGGVYGGLWGLLDGFVFGLIVGLVYNFCMCGCCIRKHD